MDFPGLTVRAVTAVKSDKNIMNPVEVQQLLLCVESIPGYANLCCLLSRHAERAKQDAGEAPVAHQARRP